VSSRPANEFEQANPYSAPQSLESVSFLNEPELSLLTLARSVFICWEKLRIVYCGLLMVVTMFILGIFDNEDRRIVILIIKGAIAANVLYFAGPIIDTYVRWLSYKSAWPRWLLFCSGTLLAMFLTAVSLHEVLD
jgi:hypothetical protein